MTKPGPGKFEGNESLEISEFLYIMAPSDTLGTIDEFGWHGLVDGIDDIFKTINENPFILEMRELDLIDDDDSVIRDIKPAYIVDEDSNGFFTYTGFDSNEAARKAWKRLTDEYLVFVKAEGVEVS